MGKTKGKNISDSQLYFKLYKTSKLWLFAGITLFSFGLIGSTPVTTNADTNVNQLASTVSSDSKASDKNSTNQSSETPPSQTHAASATKNITAVSQAMDSKTDTSSSTGNSAASSNSEGTPSAGSTQSLKNSATQTSDSSSQESQTSTESSVKGTSSTPANNRQVAIPVKYVDHTGKAVAKDSFQNGIYGQSYDAKDSILKIKGYTSKSVENQRGIYQLTNNPITVHYQALSEVVHVHYMYNEVGGEAEYRQKTLHGLYGDQYHSRALNLTDGDWLLTKTSKNTSGVFSDLPINVYYYYTVSHDHIYEHKDQSMTYVDILANNVLGLLLHTNANGADVVFNRIFNRNRYKVRFSTDTGKALQKDVYDFATTHQYQDEKDQLLYIITIGKDGWISIHTVATGKDGSTDTIKISSAGKIIKFVSASQSAQSRRLTDRVKTEKQSGSASFTRGSQSNEQQDKFGEISDSRSDISQPQLRHVAQRNGQPNELPQTSEHSLVRSWQASLAGLLLLNLIVVSWIFKSYKH